MNNLLQFIKRFLVGLKLGSNLFEKIKASFGLVFISFLSGLEFEIKIFGRKSKVFLSNGSDAAVMVGVFFDDEYKLPQNFSVKRILDLGANIGMASLYFSLRDPSTSIISVEPDPNNIILLRKNTENKNIKIIQGAIDKCPGIKEFYPIKGQGMSSSFIRRFSANSIEVKTYSIYSLLDEMGWRSVDLVKFDVEGAEFDVFENLKPNISKAFVGEYHADLTRKTISEFIDIFSGYKSEIKKVNKHRYIVFLFRDQSFNSLD